MPVAPKAWTAQFWTRFTFLDDRSVNPPYTCIGLAVDCGSSFNHILRVKHRAGPISTQNNVGQHFRDERVFDVEPSQIRIERRWFHCRNTDNQSTRTHAAIADYKSTTCADMQISERAVGYVSLRIILPNGDFTHLQKGRGLHSHALLGYNCNFHHRYHRHLVELLYTDVRCRSQWMQGHCQGIYSCHC